MKTIEKKTIRHLLFQAFFMSVLCLLSSCSDDNKVDAANVPEDWIQGLPESVSFKVNGGEQNLGFTLAEGVEESKISYMMPEDAESWCTVSIGNGNINIKVTPFGYSRLANITLIYDSSHTKVLQVSQITDFSDYFADETCSKLREGITDEEIDGIPNDIVKQLAIELKNETYEKEFRVASYRPYQHPDIMAEKNKTSYKYSLRDNPTGIWAKQGEEMYVMVGKLYDGAEVSLMFHDLDGGYGNTETVRLAEGLNKITAPMGGLVYVMNHVQDDIPLVLESEADKQAAAAKTVNIHFIEGSVNGCFDIQKHDDEDWKRMLENNAQSGYKYIDILGKYAHITWEANQFRIYNKVKGFKNITEIIKHYDDLVWQEQEFAGLVKYDRTFNNRLHFCNDQTASNPNASNYRTVYPGKYESETASAYSVEMFLDPDRYVSRLWGPAHEAGHVNQVTPGVKWIGTTEITNNIYSLYCQYVEWKGQTKLGKNTVKNEGGNYKDENGTSYNFSTWYESAIDLIVNGERAHSLPGIASIVRENQVVPFWQLYLYLVVAQGKEDFYKDLYEYFRNNPSPSENGENGGMDQLDFVRQVCRIANLDLTDFFEKWGFLKAVSATLNDYGSKSILITQKDVDALKEEIKNANYPKPEHDDIYLITDATVDDYRN